jgi:periplasmic nitrate reductase NapD
MAISRRQFLRGHSSASQIHISSLVVHCRADVVEAVIAAINHMPDAEVPQHSEQGKLVVLLETANESHIMQRISEIEQLSGVINTALVYHQIDDETEETA